MSCRNPAVSLLAFYANHTLGEAQRLKVESHVAECDDCRRLLGLARAAHEQMRDKAFDPAAHVQAQLLAEYAGRPGALDEESRAWAASHLEGCEVCASAVTLLRGMSSGTMSAPEIRAGPRGFRLWNLLATTILRPAPALAYLALVVAGTVWIARVGGPALPPPGPAELLAPPVSVHGDIAMRGAGGALPPLEVPIPAEGPVRLALHTDLDPEETAPGASRLRLILRRGAELLWSAPVDPENFLRDGILEVTLRPDQLPTGVALEVALLPDAQGDPAPLFVRQIVLLEPGAAESPAHR